MVIIGLEDGRNAWFELVIYGGCEPLDIDAVDWARLVDGMGAGEILLPGMGRDGTNDGYDLSMTRAVCDAVNVPVITSGFAANPGHMLESFENTGADVVLLPGTFHRGVGSKVNESKFTPPTA